MAISEKTKKELELMKAIGEYSGRKVKSYRISKGLSSAKNKLTIEVVLK